jgi:hypothetical protein
VRRGGTISDEKRKEHQLVRRGWNISCCEEERISASDKRIEQKLMRRGGNISWGREENISW